MTTTTNTNKITVKWNKTMYKDVALPPTGAELKTILRQLTGILEERQSLMCKELWKGLLGNDFSFAGVSVPPGKEILVTLMGTPTETVQKFQDAAAAQAKVVFMEDISSNSTKTGKLLPPGLANLGNTCYLNSTIQMLRTAPELTAAIASVGSAPNDNNNNNNNLVGGALSPSDVMVARELKKLFTQMGSARDSVIPLSFVSAVRTAFPRFNEQTPRGGYIQQDSDDFYNELMGALNRSFTPWTSGGAGSSSALKNAVDDYFTVEYTIRTKCLENESEPETVSHDRSIRMQCTINTDVTHLDAGLRLGLAGQVEKRSESLGRDALYSRTLRISKLPKYLVVQLNRFFWKATPDSQDHRGINCKILKGVKFPAVLDVYDYCDEALKSLLKVERDKRAEAIFSGNNKENKKNKMEIAEDNKAPGGGEEEDDEELKRALAISMAPSVEVDVPARAGVGLPPTFSGRYELMGVVSHKGRSSNSGHYMAWTKLSGPPGPGSKWICFDDEHPSECQWQDVETLAGGGDYHIAYMLLYKALDD